jgi:hypothetical protein
MSLKFSSYLTFNIQFFWQFFLKKLNLCRTWKGTSIIIRSEIHLRCGRSKIVNKNNEWSSPFSNPLPHFLFFFSFIWDWSYPVQLEKKNEQKQESFVGERNKETTTTGRARWLIRLLEGRKGTKTTYDGRFLDPVMVGLGRGRGGWRHMGRFSRPGDGEGKVGS